MEKRLLNFREFSLFIFSLFLFTSCSSTKYFYQVYDVKAIDVPIVDNQYVYNNEDITVSYNFCSNKGNMTFYCFNKSGKIIYILLDNSFYINNGIAYDYYKNVEYTSTASLATNEYASSNLTLSLIAGTSKIGYNQNYADSFGSSVSRATKFGYSALSSQSYSTTEHMSKVVAIPPHSAKFIDGFTILDKAILQCGEEMYNQNYPKHNSQSLTYSSIDSPVTFSNHISYSFNRDGTETQNFVNSFYIGSIQNRAEPEVREKNPNYNPNEGFGKTKDPCRSNERFIFTIDSPTCFYNIFKK
ncbi:MAG: hypothetical protein NC127_04160 [Muribaculum sp.]|nr:hypothetical protein [Muribaculum sp.]